MKEPEFNPETGEELEEGCYMMAKGEDGLCHPVTGCPGCAQERRWRACRKCHKTPEEHYKDKQGQLWCVGNVSEAYERTN